VIDRRTFLARATAVGVLGALAGCGGRDVGPETPPPSTPTPRPGEPPTSTPTPTPPDERPVVFLSPDEVAAIRKKLAGRAQPWYDAYRKLIADADAAVRASPKSVVDNGSPAGVDNPRKYGSDAPYQSKDGVFSDDIDRRDYFASLDMKDWIRDPALAYAFTGEDRYARAAIDNLHHWFLDERTGVYPSANNYGPDTEGLKSQNSIEYYIFIPAMVHGAALVSGHPYWTEKPNGEPALRNWMTTFQESLNYGSRGGLTGDEIYKWWVTTRAAVAAYLGDESGLEAAFRDWRTTALTDYEDRGTFAYARQRTRGLFYSLSALNALTLCADIARHHGVDLYSYTRDGDSTPVLQQAHQYHAPILLDPSRWQWQELDGLSASEREYGLVSYELAYSQRRDDQFLSAIQTSGRPIYDQRILGWVTLTHGNAFALDLSG
jgi:hypothetical protein